MPIHMRGNYIFVAPGEPCFLVSSDYTNYLEIGRPGLDDFFLIAYIQEKHHFIDAALFGNNGKPVCRVARNHLDELFEGDWEVKTRVDGGFAVVNSDDRNLMNLRLLNGGICLIEGKFYNKSGELVASGNDQDFLIFKGPAVIGKSGLAKGIVING